MVDFDLREKKKKKDRALDRILCHIYIIFKNFVKISKLRYWKLYCIYFLKYLQEMGSRNLSVFTWPMTTLAAGTRNLFNSLYELHVSSAYSRFVPWQYVLFSFCNVKKWDKILSFQIKVKCTQGTCWVCFFFPVRLLRHWKRLPKEIVESQSLEAVRV